MHAMSVVLIALGAACLVFGISSMLNESKMRFHLFWIALGTVLAAMGAALATGLWDTLPAGVRLLAGSALGAFALYELVTHALILRHFHDAPGPGLDYAIVLGAQVFDSGPGYTLVTRLDAACAYLSANPQTYCITCGGQGRNEPMTEACASAEYLIERGIDSARIVREESSHSTFQNLSNAVALVDPMHDSVGVVTNDYHLFRALLLARKAGFVRPVGIAAKAPARFPVNNTVRESFALAKDLFLTSLHPGNQLRRDETDQKHVQ